MQQQQHHTPTEAAIFRLNTNQKQIQEYESEKATATTNIFIIFYGAKMLCCVLYVYMNSFQTKFIRVSLAFFFSFFFQMEKFNRKKCEGK